MPICAESTYRILYLPCSLSLDQVFNLDTPYIVIGSIYTFCDINHQYIKVYSSATVPMLMITKFFIYLHIHPFPQIMYHYYNG